MSESSTHHLAMAWDLDKMPKHDMLFEMARGYMHAAIVIFEEQQRAEHATFYNLLPGHFALAQSAELFLKAAVSLRGIQPPITHNLKHLHSCYRKLFPEEKLAFQCRIGELIDWGKRYANGQDARYPFDQKGKVWLPHEHINIELTLKVIREFSVEFERLELVLRKAIQTDEVSTA
jgi:HEPN domain-containing protein